jgi:hypothetical protein
MRWDIETFYRDFKQTLRGASWHCRTPIRLHQEILVHMIALCMIRLAMVEAGHQKNTCVAQLSFTRALTGTRLFLKLLVAATDLDLWPSIRKVFVQCCARHRVNSKPGRKPKSKAATPLRPQPETRKGPKGQLFLLRSATKRCVATCFVKIPAD